MNERENLEKSQLPFTKMQYMDIIQKQSSKMQVDNIN